MSHQQSAPTGPAIWAEKEPALPFITQCHRVALDTLGSAFEEACPLTIMTGEGKSGGSFLIRRFLAGIDGDVALVRITEPCPDATVAMREVIRAIGFDPKDMSLADLENIFTMFLSFQRTHHRRTIICIEEAQDHGRWVLEEIRRLVEVEKEEKFGLMVVLSGRPSLNELLNEPPLDAIDAQAKHIILAPFTLAETREYIRRRLEAAGTTNIAKVFEFDAITLIHELCGGVPDAVSTLSCKCLQLAHEGDGVPVTTDVVKQAGRLLRLPPLMQQSDAEAGRLEVNGVMPPHGRLIVRMNGEVIQEQPLNRGRILIGRDELCDVHIDSRLVSRQHALVVNSPKGARLVDLRSTNGTFVDGRKIKQYVLQDGDVMALADCTIEYVAGDDRSTLLSDVERAASFDLHNTDPNPLQVLEAEQATISSAHHRARR